MATTRKPEKTRSCTPLQDELLKVASGAIGPAVAVKIVVRKFADAGIRMTARERGELKQAISLGELDRFSLSRSRKNASVVTFTEEDGNALTAEASGRVMGLFHRALKQSDRHSADALKALHSKWPSEHARQYREMIGFRRRLRQQWQRPFALFTCS